MGPVVKAHSETSSQDGRIVAYADWVDWNIKLIVQTSLWLLFMSAWFAVPAIQKIRACGGANAPIAVAGAHDTILTVSVVWAGAICLILLIADVVLLVSCLAVRQGWLQRSI